jgi:hypothetical protein
MKKENETTKMYYFYINNKSIDLKHAFEINKLQKIK